MTRDEVALAEPPTPQVLAAQFPRRPAHDAPGPWFRAHAADRPGPPDGGAWWYSSVEPPSPPGGRFDLVAPRGTFYAANDIEAAVRERLGVAWGSRRYLPEAQLRQTAVHEVSLPTDADLADTDHPDAAGLVTREIASGAPYTLTSRYPAAFDQAGFAGILSPPRLTPGAGIFAVALYGTAGRPAPPRPARRSRTGAARCGLRSRE